MKKKLLNSIVFSGKISSGKSSISCLLSKELKLPILSFGGFLKDYCLKNSIEISRENLQKVGQSIVDSNPKQFLEDVIENGNINSQNVIFEGLRHVNILNLIKEISYNCILIFIEVNSTERYHRYLQRKKDIDNYITVQEFNNQNNHEVEKEIDKLRDMSDFIIEANNLQINANQVYQYVAANLILSK